MNSELSSASVPASTLPALPVRRRETLEIFDTALKLYRRYFWVLLGWSALVSGASFVPFVQYLAFIFALPVFYGAVSCCVAAAVRGQSVKFSQCWAFTKPRYWSLVGATLLSYLVLFGIEMVVIIVGLLVGLLGFWALSNAPLPLQITGIVIGTLLGLVAFSILMMVAFAWTGMVPIVVCLEDDKRSAAALGRAFDLLKGNWMRVFGLALILGLAIIAVLIIVTGVYFLIGAGATSTIFSSNPSESAVTALLGTFAAFTALFALVWNPAQSLIIAVLYLDLRVRREALDLEWSAYASAPEPTPGLAPVDFLTPTALAPTIPAQDETALSTSPTSFAAAPASFGVENRELAPEAAPQLATTDSISTLASNEVPSAAASSVAMPSSSFASDSAPASVFPAPPPSSSFSGVPAPINTFFADPLPASVSPANSTPDNTPSSGTSAMSPAPDSTSENISPPGVPDNSSVSDIFPDAIEANGKAAETGISDRVFPENEQVHTAPSDEAKRD